MISNTKYFQNLNFMPASKDEDKVYKIDYILARKKHKNTRFYLIKWEGYSFDNCSWEPETNLNPDLIEQEYDNTKHHYSKLSFDQINRCNFDFIRLVAKKRSTWATNKPFHNFDKSDALVSSDPSSESSSESISLSSESNTKGNPKKSKTDPILDLNDSRLLQNKDLRDIVKQTQNRIKNIKSTEYPHNIIINKQSQEKIPPFTFITENVYHKSFNRLQQLIKSPSSKLSFGPGDKHFNLIKKVEQSLNAKSITNQTKQRQKIKNETGNDIKKTQQENSIKFEHINSIENNEIDCNSVSDEIEICSDLDENININKNKDSNNLNNLKLEDIFKPKEICCSCEDFCIPGICECIRNSDGIYTTDRLLQGEFLARANALLVECSDKCTCHKMKCWNRVCQLSDSGFDYYNSPIYFEIFRSRRGGLGLNTKSYIKKGSFVIEYVGEVIDEHEAQQRGRLYDIRRLSYLWSIYTNGERAKLLPSIDATFCGNAARFINHSCEPNLRAILFCSSGGIDFAKARVAFFAKRNIPENTELTIDYNYKINNENSNPIICKCGAKKCKGRLL